MKQLRSDNLEKESAANRLLSSYNKSIDQLETINKEINRCALFGFELKGHEPDSLARRYERSGGEAELRACETQIRELDASIRGANESVAAAQAALNSLDKEASESKAYERNISDNQDLRLKRKEISRLEEQHEALDVEQAQKADRKFDSDYSVVKKKQKDAEAQVRARCHHSRVTLTPILRGVAIEAQRRDWPTPGVLEGEEVGDGDRVQRHHASLSGTAHQSQGASW